MNIVVTGVKGQLGHDVVREFTTRGYSNVLGIDITDLDITNRNDVESFFVKNKPYVIVHCAAYTAVDKAEDNKELCMKVNVEGTKNLVEIATKYNSKIVYISTDYVFDGLKSGEYEISDSPNPKSVYGESKYLGEVAARKHSKHFIVRISWVFGKNGQNFVKTMLSLGKGRESLNVVNDQIGSPTYTLDLSKLLVDMIETDKYGTYHATNEETCTWYEFTKEIFRLSNINIPVNPIMTDQYPTKAFRPKNSCMSKQSLVDNGFNRLPSWKDALKRYLKEIEVIE
ncbi:MAG TPA: dTDP-4-dehydrorhamnose reductase [Acholeplasmataceae bacterium]|nr:dTDP-4-dehydrorhamnose reductase [Acholeplasmataceae bacterium]